MNTITQERYEELIKAEHSLEIIKRYIAGEDFISTAVLKKILDMKENGVK